MTAELYGTDWCGYCRRAKTLLKARGITYEEFIVGEDISQAALTEKIGKPAQTVPQIFIDGEYVGGYTELSTRLSAS